MELNNSNIILKKEELIQQIVKRLQKFGFVHVNASNISTDEVYAFYFEKILKEMLGENIKKDVVIKEILSPLTKL